jgi:6-phosphogluconolactonase/glucosamine-6-phosphate isomerase/deaminase
MGARTADFIADSLVEQSKKGKQTVLWLMAAPSGFAFYDAFINRARIDEALCDTLRNTHFFQFDDYPVSRETEKFVITFRHLLEERLFNPLRRICSDLPYVHFLELTGTSADTAVCNNYKQSFLNIRNSDSYIVQLKGIGMDGHWGFHGDGVPLFMEPDLIKVKMESQNIHQQMVDWPDLFKRAEDVPEYAYSFNVEMFMMADEIYDNVPQASKMYSVLAAYATSDVMEEIPSSALKLHPHARALVTADAARAFIEYRKNLEERKQGRLSEKMIEQLRDLWRGGGTEEEDNKNIKKMEHVLIKAGIM